MTGSSKIFVFFSFSKFLRQNIITASLLFFHPKSLTSASLLSFKSMVLISLHVIACMCVCVFLNIIWSVHIMLFICMFLWLKIGHCRSWLMCSSQEKTTFPAPCFPLLTIVLCVGLRPCGLSQVYIGKSLGVVLIQLLFEQYNIGKILYLLLQTSPGDTISQKTPWSFSLPLLQCSLVLRFESGL